MRRKRTREKGGNICEGHTDRALPLDREETDTAHRKMEVCKGGNLVLSWIV